ncbi:MAG: ABC transporter permease [Oscillospiraceae bacterium]|nr:ABC transporter permease [Oscillospiraceae bacterium]
MAKLSRHTFRSNTLPAITTVGPVTLWLAFFVAVPLIYVLIMSFCSLDEGYNVVFKFTLANYQRLLDPNYIQIYGTSLFVAFITTALCIVVGYPFSFLIARTTSKHKALLYMLVIIPFWTNSLIRIYGWRTLLGTNGWINNLLIMMNLTDTPVEFLFNRGATILGMFYCLFPYMVLPLYTAIEKLDKNLLEASADLGAKSRSTFTRVIIPLTMSGIFSGSIMVFIPSLGYFFVSDILGGGNSDVIGNLIECQFQSGNNWPLGAALSIILILITLLLVKLYQKLGGDMDNLGV